jgi:hypothetical protein
MLAMLDICADWLCYLDMQAGYEDSSAWLAMPAASNAGRLYMLACWLDMLS